MATAVPMALVIVALAMGGSSVAQAARIEPLAPFVSLHAQRPMICASFRQVRASSALQFGARVRSSAMPSGDPEEAHEELNRLASGSQVERHLGPARVLNIMSRLYRLVGNLVEDLDPGEITLVLDTLDVLVLANLQSKNSRAYALRTIVAASCSSAARAPHLKRMMDTWDAAVWRRTPLPIPILSSAWYALDAFAQSKAASSDVLQRVAESASSLLDADRYGRASCLCALRVFGSLVGNDAADVSALRIVVHTGRPLVGHCPTACAAAADETFGAIATRLLMDDDLETDGNTLAELAVRSLVLAGQGSYSAPLCVNLLRALADASHAPSAATPSLRFLGLPMDVVGHIGDFAGLPGEQCATAIGTCTSLALSPRDAQKEIASALLAAICAPSPEVGVAAARGFAEVAARDAEGLRRQIHGRDLAEMGRCLRHQPREVSATALATKVALALEGAWRYLRHRPDGQRSITVGDLRELCGGLRAHSGLVASVPSVATPAFRWRLAAICDGA